MPWRRNHWSMTKLSSTFVRSLHCQALCMAPVTLQLSVPCGNLENTGTIGCEELWSHHHIALIIFSISACFSQCHISSYSSIRCILLHAGRNNRWQCLKADKMMQLSRRMEGAFLPSKLWIQRRSWVHLLFFKSASKPKSLKHMQILKDWLAIGSALLATI